MTAKMERFEHAEAGARLTRRRRATRLNGTNTRENPALGRRTVFDHVFRLGEDHLASPIGLPAFYAEVGIARVADEPGLIRTCVNIRRAAGPAFVICSEPQLAPHVEVMIA